MTETEKNELRMKVAELCPDLFVHVPSPFGPGSIHWRTGQDDNGNPVSPGAHVNILYDLSACAEFEKMLTGEGLNNQRDRYHDALVDVVIADLPPGRNFIGFDILSATALQRCLAFVKTMEQKS